MTEEYMLLEKDGYVATITINRPEQRNAMKSVMWKWLSDTLDELDNDNDVRCVVLRGIRTRRPTERPVGSIAGSSRWRPSQTLS